MANMWFWWSGPVSSAGPPNCNEPGGTNIPFRFDGLVDDTVYYPNDLLTNLILIGLDGQPRFGVTGCPRRPGWLHTVSLSVDANALLTIGVGDQAGTFIGLYPVTLLASGSQDHRYRFNTGLLMGLGDGWLPAIKYNTVGALADSTSLSGHLEILTNPADEPFL